VEVDFDRHEVRRSGTPVDLTSLEFKLLGAVCRNRGRALTREQVLDLAWGHCLAVSPDGVQVAYGVAHGAGGRDVSIEVMPSAGGPAREVYRGAVWRYRGLTRTPDQKHLLFVGPEDGSARPRSALIRLPVGGGEPVDLGIHAFGVRHPQVHPDGRRIVFGAYERSREVWTLENRPSRPAAAG
jgi:hypothetical protein